MELQDGLQIPFDGFLCDLCRRPLECPAAGSVHRPWKIQPAAPAEENGSLRTCDSRAGRGCWKDQPQTRQSSVRLLQPLPGWPFTFLKASQTSRFRDVKRLCLGHRAPPVTGWLWVAAEFPTCSSFDQAPLQNLPLYYTSCSAPVPRIGTLILAVLASSADVSLCIGATGSHVPYKSLVRLRAAYMPDVARAVFRTAPRTESRELDDPVLTSPLAFRHFISGSLALASPDHT